MTDEQIIEILKDRLDEYRFNHSLAVADEAVVLARRYGCDEQKAKTAGLLHDIMKNETKENMLDYIKKNNIQLTDVELNSQKLWHSILGSVYIKNDLNFTDKDIINAVRYHTTARAGMSCLEKVIYLADYTSADRNYEGVEQMRAAVKKDMESAMLVALEFSIGELLQKGACIHPDTINAYNEIKLRG